ncbi:MAG: hypothetical protein AAB388_03420 [Patescibacteria group bacterium]
MKKIIYTGLAIGLLAAAGYGIAFYWLATHPCNPPDPNFPGQLTCV